MVAVIAVDMDGTFLRPDDTYDRARFERLHGVLRERGIRFVVASGNQFTQLSSFFDPTARPAAFVAENGHLVAREGAAEPIAKAVLPRDEAQRVLAALTGLGHPFLMSGTDCAYVTSGTADWFVSGMRRYFHRLEVVDDLAALDVDVMKFAMITDTDPVLVGREVSEQIGDVLSVVVSGPRDLDLNQPGVHKAHGLGLLLDGWGVAWEDVVAFGDGGNDVELLTAAGRGYAMAQARDELVAVATHRAGSNAEDGVLDAIEELLS